MNRAHWPKYGSSRVGHFRDEVARRITTFALDRIATKRYAARVEAAIRLGLPAAREEETADAPKISIDWLRANAARSDREAARQELSNAGVPKSNIGTGGADAALNLAFSSRRVTDEDVEIASAAYWPHNPKVTPHEWATIPEFMKRATRARMRRALEALRHR
ncbi:MULTISPECIES: hypothetical protein [unclassified Microbacterium]|uniref:hypothetical protein n=1 Tax=unclassified Microbacterium TaxID=2609290 RepID=UPI002469398F|nr:MULTISPECIES: hypothetical protein [unclassified Microbacterium]MDH5133627.1 hypothetical protein [Microbacterium sp. RD10]MDH5137878.1 hypothetical protein [Microbacterium sp. RD11]MDH5145530.1 hypothetical protein [Microbacterium sp. RD12]MDH5156138.1 hypothetical protein [Microbacterium sp. RD06]MDH5166374.1 hypothetical protein [Microbacterium sp. RD02]